MQAYHEGVLILPQKLVIVTFLMDSINDMYGQILGKKKGAPEGAPFIKTPVNSWIRLILNDERFVYTATMFSACGPF